MRGQRYQTDMILVTGIGRDAVAADDNSRILHGQLGAEELKRNSVLMIACRFSKLHI
jgi:hypothetical protein